MKLFHKSLLAAAVVALMTPVAVAEEYVLSLNHTSSSTASIVFYFTQSPVLTVENPTAARPTIVLTRKVEKDGQTVTDTYKKAINRLKDITITRSTGLDELVVDVNGRIIPKGECDFALTGFEIGTPVSITSVNGVQLFSTVIADSDPLYISMDSYEPGIYIIAAGDETLKYVKQ